MADLRLNISTITFNINDLNIPVKDRDSHCIFKNVTQ